MPSFKIYRNEILSLIFVEKTTLSKVFTRSIKMYIILQTIIPEIFINRNKT